MDVVDKILFASGDAKVKKEGLDVLKRVVDILKNLKDKAIIVEGHTDNVQIRGSLAKVYPTNWELPPPEPSMSPDTSSSRASTPNC